MKNSPLELLVQQAQALLRNVWKRQRLAVASAWATAALAALVVPLVPQRYESWARVHVDTQSVLKPMMAGLAYQPDVDRYVRMLARTVISPANLEPLLERPELGLPVATQEDREDTLDKLESRIKLSAEEPGALYTISYRDTDPYRAQRVVSATVDLFVNLGANTARRNSKDADKFVAEQVRSTEARLLEAERKLKEFRVTHYAMYGVPKEDFFSRIATSTQEVERLRGELRGAEVARDVYRGELSREQPQSPLDMEIASQRKLLDDLLKRLGDQHPDVVGTREAIAHLEARRRTGGAERSVAANPTHLRLRGLVAESEASIASLRSKLAIEQQRLEDMRALAQKAPKLDAELGQLTLDYEAIRKNYDQLVSRRESSSLGVKLDESSRLVEFNVVDPPKVSGAPVFPSHMTLGLLAVLASVAAALVVPTVAELIEPTIEDASALREFTGARVIGTITAVSTDSSLRDKRAGMVRIGIAAALLVAFQSCWLAWMHLHW